MELKYFLFPWLSWPIIIPIYFHQNDSLYDCSPQRTAINRCWKWCQRWVSEAGKASRAGYQMRFQYEGIRLPAPEVWHFGSLGVWHWNSPKGKFHLLWCFSLCWLRKCSFESTDCQNGNNPGCTNHEILMQKGDVPSSTLILNKINCSSRALSWS